MKRIILFMALYFTQGCANHTNYAAATFGTTTPIFLGVNPQAIVVDADWNTLLASIDLAAEHGVTLIDLMLTNRTPTFLSLLNTKLGARNVKLLIRFDLDTADSTLSESWLSTQKANINTLVGNVNMFLPNRVIGYRPVAMTGGEWFLRNPDDGVTAPPKSLAIRVASVQAQLAQTIKIATHGTALVGFNAGYLFTLSYINGDAHAQFQTVLDCPDIDFIVAPYDYIYSRQVNQPFLPQGPMDSPNLHGKVWITEDDTRTSIAAADAYKFSTGTADDVSLMTRNVTGAINHNTGLYVFDLFNKGWFNTEAIWNAIDAAKASAVHTNPTTLVLLNDITLAAQPQGTIPYGQIPLAIFNTGGAVRYAIQSDVDAGLVRLSDYTTIVNLN